METSHPDIARDALLYAERRAEGFGDDRGRCEAVLRVAEAASECGRVTGDGEAIAAAALSALEAGCRPPMGELMSRFGPRVAAILAVVEYACDPPRDDEDWRTAVCDRAGVLGETVDRGTLSACLAALLVEATHLMDDLYLVREEGWALHGTACAEDQIWRHEHLADALRPRLGDVRAFRSYDDIVHRGLPIYAPETYPDKEDYGFAEFAMGVHSLGLGTGVGYMPKSGASRQGGGQHG